MNDVPITVMFLKVRDEYRADFDAGRGGYGKIMQQKLGPGETAGGYPR